MMPYIHSLCKSICEPNILLDDTFVIFRKLLDLNLNPPARESRYVEVFVLVVVAIGLFEVAPLLIGVDEAELVLIDSGLFFLAQF